MYYRPGCKGEVYGDDGDKCGWIYWNMSTDSEFEVTCDDFAGWWWC